MKKIHLLTIKALLVLSLTGCAFSLQQAKLPNYSLGPVSSNEFPNLLHDAIAESEGEVHVFGKAEWFGFRDSGNFPVLERYFIAVAAITNTDILLLKWYQPESRYKIIKRFPYSEFESVSAASNGTLVFLYFNDKELSIGDQHYVIFERTSLSFTKPSGVLVDREKTEAAFSFLKDKIKLHEDTPLPENSFDKSY